MLASSNEKQVIDNVFSVFEKDLLPVDHIKFLQNLRERRSFRPKVIYDIGSAVLHWYRHARRIWEGSQIVCFDAFSPLEHLYKACNVDYQMACLSDNDDSTKHFYQNDIMFGGNSLFREIGFDKDITFPKENYVLKQTITLDSVVKQNKYPFPDLIKIDAQGGELDILKGASECLEHATYLIVELQHVEYNEGANLAPVVIDFLKNIGWVLTDSKFSDNGPDADYCFRNMKNICKINI
jgi:FkbM family methyltransferase